MRTAFEERKRKEALELAKLKKAGRFASPALLSGGGLGGGLDGVIRYAVDPPGNAPCVGRASNIQAHQPRRRLQVRAFQIHG